MTSAQQQLQVLESSLQRVERDDRELARDVQQVTQQINARYDVLMTWVKQSRDDLLEEVKAKEVSAKCQLSAEKTATSVTMDMLSALVSCAARISGNDPEVVSLKDELREALLSEDKLDQHRQQADRQEASWRWKYDVTEASLVQQDEVRAYMGRMVDGSVDDVTRSLSLKELADKVDRLVNHITETKNDVTAYKDEVSALKDDVQSKTTSLTTDVTDLVKKTSTLNDDITTLRKSEAELTKTTSSLQNELTKTTSSLKDEIRTAGRMVSFCARGLDNSKTKLYNPMVFSDVRVNEGSCYDNTTGVFTAPVPGTYVFSASIVSNSNSTVSAGFVVDGTTNTWIRGSNTSTGSSSLSVQLGVGQTVWIQTNNKPDDYFNTFYQTSFTGALVQPQL